MKKIKYILIVLMLGAFINSCQDNLLVTDLTPESLNDPTPTSAAANKKSFTTFSRGIYTAVRDGDWNLWVVRGYHESMADVTSIPWGNFGSRWINQTESITLDDGTVVTPPSGGPQPGEIARLNTRLQGNDNVTRHEWRGNYILNNHANVILETLDKLPESITVSEVDAFRAWALWWKAFAYHKLGSMYEQGVINDESFTLNNNFVPNTALIAESNRLLDEVEALANSNLGNSEFEAILSDLHQQPNSPRVDVAGLIAQVNTLRARNLVYNTKVTDMTAAQWGQVLTWANNGISSNTQSFQMVSTNEFIFGSWVADLNFFWYWPSLRLVQEIDQLNDNRFTDLMRPFTRTHSRGIQYGTTHVWTDESALKSNEDDALVTMHIAGTHEENELFLAEAKIRTGDIEGGLAHIDAVRTIQNSGLAPIVGTSLTEAQALEELRKETRLALVFRGVNFYHARRNGFSSGSRTGVYVIDGTGNLNTNATIEYGYLDYWPVTTFETDFNPIGGSISAQVN